MILRVNLKAEIIRIVRGKNQKIMMNSIIY